MTPVLVEFFVGRYFVVAVRRSNAGVFDAFNARINRVEEAITTPEPSASSSATPSASEKKPAKTVAPSPTPEPSPAQ